MLLFIFNLQHIMRIIIRPLTFSDPVIYYFIGIITSECINSFVRFLLNKFNIKNIFVF